MLPARGGGGAVRPVRLPPVLGRQAGVRLERGAGGPAGLARSAPSLGLALRGREADAVPGPETLAYYAAPSPMTALGDHADESRRKEIGLDAHVDDPRDRADGMVGVECRENEVARQRRLHGDLRCFAIANLTDHDDVGVLPERVFQDAGEG